MTWGKEIIKWGLYQGTRDLAEVGMYGGADEAVTGDDEGIGKPDGRLEDMTELDGWNK